MKREAFKQYLQYEKRFSINTIKAYENDLDQFLKYLKSIYEITLADQIKHIHIRSWLVSLMSAGRSNRSINRKLSTLKTYFRFLIRQGSIDVNPMQKVVSPKNSKRLPNYVGLEGMETVLQSRNFGTDYPGIRDRMILLLLYQTGMRRSELLHLKLSDILWSEGLLKVLGKGNKERLIPFGQSIRTDLEAYLTLREQTFPESPENYFF